MVSGLGIVFMLLVFGLVLFEQRCRLGPPVRFSTGSAPIPLNGFFRRRREGHRRSSVPLGLLGRSHRLGSGAEGGVPARAALPLARPRIDVEVLPGERVSVRTVGLDHTRRLVARHARHRKGWRHRGLRRRRQEFGRDEAEPTAGDAIGAAETEMRVDGPQPRDGHVARLPGTALNARHFGRSIPETTRRSRDPHVVEPARAGLRCVTTLEG